MASKEYKRIQAAWGDVQDTRGNHYVPDMTTSMDLSTLKSNRAKMAEAVRFWNEDPCAPNPPATASSDRMCNIKNDSDIVSTLKAIRSFVAGKLKAYDDRIAVLSPAPVVNQPTTAPVNTVPQEVIGAGTTDTVTTDTGVEVNDPVTSGVTPPPPAEGTLAPAAASEGEGKAIKIAIGITALFVIIAIVVVIKRKK